jgi:hypothetical protein
MQQILQARFAPRWIKLIYMTSIVEAIGLAVHFSAPLTAPEMASLQPPLIATQIPQEASSTAAAQPDCLRCLQFARTPQHAAIKGGYADHNTGGSPEAR